MFTQYRAGKLREALLGGLHDPLDAISNTLFQFWDSHLASDTMSRFNQVFSEMYAVHEESYWLNCVTPLLLQLSQKSPDYERVLFDALADSEFKEMTIDTNFVSLAASV